MKMNRVIKFRAIHKLTKKVWDEEELIFHNGKWYEDWRAFEDGMSLNMDQCEVMQYSGLKDKNGVEIYEGDICYDFYSEENGVVKFDEGKFVYDKETQCYDLSEVTGDIELIGNIYENPELVEVES